MLEWSRTEYIQTRSIVSNNTPYNYSIRILPSACVPRFQAWLVCSTAKYGYSKWSSPSRLHHPLGQGGHPISRRIRTNEKRKPYDTPSSPTHSEYSLRPAQFKKELAAPIVDWRLGGHSWDLGEGSSAALDRVVMGSASYRIIRHPGQLKTRRVWLDARLNEPTLRVTS